MSQLAGEVNATRGGSHVVKKLALPPLSAIDLNKLKLRSKYFNVSGIIHKLKKHNSLLSTAASSAITTTATTTTKTTITEEARPSQHGISNLRALDSAAMSKQALIRPVKNAQQLAAVSNNILSNFKYPANLFGNNKTFIDIKNEFIMFLRNRLAAQSLATDNATAPVTSMSNKITSKSSLPYSTSMYTAASPQFIESSELYDPDSVSYYKFNRNNGSDDLFNIWKLAFFLLSFVIGLVFLLTVLSLTLKFIFSKFRKRSRFQVKPTMNECSTMHKKLSNLNFNRHQVSSISLFEYNSSASGLCEATKFEQKPKTQIQHRTRTVSLSSMSTNATLAAVTGQSEEVKKTVVDQNIATNTGHVRNESLRLKKTTMAAGKMSSFKHNSNPNLSSIDDRFVKSSSLIESIFESKTPSYFCDIAADRTFLDDFELNRACVDRNGENAAGNMKCFTSFKNGLVYTISKSNAHQNEVNWLDVGGGQNQSDAVKKQPCKKIEIGFEKKQCAKDGFIPWRLTTTTSSNEYEGVEAESMSGVTAYSEVIEENEDAFSSEESSEYNGDSTEMVKDVDLIHGSADDRYESKKITRELEMKLKERRDLIESSKFKPRVLAQETSTLQQQQIGLKRCEARGNVASSPPPPPMPQNNEFINNYRNFNSVFSSTLPIRPVNKTAVECVAVVEKKGTTPSKPLFNPKSAVTAVKYEIINKDDQIETGFSNRNNNNNNNNKSRQLVAGPPPQPSSANADFATNQSNKSAKIMVDDSFKLPAKRESIKMLIDNKLVTENKQRTDLESQLNALLKYKTNK